jgi:serine protease Do
MLSITLLIILVSTTGCVYFGLEPSSTPLSTITPSPINTSFTPPPTTDSRPVPTVPDYVDAIAVSRPSVVAINTQVPAISIFGNSLEQEGAGSGWIIDANGLIVTNYHVVEGASEISVTLEDGQHFTAELVRGDKVSDLAVIKISAANLKAAEVADSDKLRVGDWVAALGNSLGQGISATKGIVSALGVSITVGIGESLYDLIQTDAAINPGNSGGPLVNLLGQVTGITSVKVSQVGVEGMGYAISTREAMPIINDLITIGYVKRPWMGVSLYSVDQIVVLRYDLKVNRGALVTQVVTDSPADKAGIQAGDVITAVNGEEVTVVDDLNDLIHSYQIGQEISVTYFRGSEKNTVSLTLAESPPIS